MELLKSVKNDVTASVGMRPNVGGGAVAGPTVVTWK